MRSLPFETAIIERYRGRETSVEEALIKMSLASVSVRRVEDITQVLWRTCAPASTCACQHVILICPVSMRDASRNPQHMTDVISLQPPSNFEKSLQIALDRWRGA